MEDRFEKIKQLLSYKDIIISDDEFDSLSVVFQYSRPINEVDIIENLSKLRDMGAISIESALSHSPYTNDIKVEMEKIRNEGSTINTE